MDRADTFEKVYEDLAGTYTKGTFGSIEKDHNHLWLLITEKEEEINANWDQVNDNQFTFMCKSLKKLLLEGIMLGRKHV
ncbi:MAG: hypothetical protein ACYSTS_00570 [Planctomycetota bacterium]|jgi:hypothetical protein